MTTFTTPINQVSSLYVGYFGRAGDPSGTNYWLGQLNAGAITLANMASSFASQPDAKAKYPYLANPAIGDPGAFVDQVFQNLFNHTADVAGRAYWVAQLTAAGGTASAVGSMILNIISGASGGDSTTITNKVDVSSDFTVKASNAGTTWNANAAAQSSAEVASVNDTAASVTAAKAMTDAYIAAAPGPQSNFTLGIDTLTTSAQNANFNAPMIFNAPTGALVQSLQSGDAAIDTASPAGPGLSNKGLFTGVLDALVSNVMMRNIPTHSVTALGGGIAGYSGDITGLTTLINSSSVVDLQVGAAGGGIDKGGVAGTTTTAGTLLNTIRMNNVSGNTTVFLNAAALAGASDGLRIDVAGTFGTSLAPNTISAKTDTAAAGQVMNGYETLDINAAGATFLRLADATSGIASTTGLGLSGAGSLSLFGEATEAHFTKVTTIDAATQTGGVTITGATTAGGFLTGNTVLTSFKGGSGADSLDISSMTAAQAGAFATLDGGGGNDTLVVAPAVLNATTPLPATSFEVLGVAAGLVGTIDYSMLGGVGTIRLVGLATVADIVFNNLPSGITFDSQNFANGSRFNLNGPAGTFDILNILTTDIGLTGVYFGLNVSDFETVNLTASGNVIWGSDSVVRMIPSAGGLLTFNLIDNVDTGGGEDILFVSNLDVGLGTINVFSTDPSIVSGYVSLGTVTASVVNASGLHPGASPTTRGLEMFGDAANPITILGSVGADRLVGSLVNDTIFGGAGNDTLSGDPGGDVITTGTGADTLGVSDNFASSIQGIEASGQNLTASIAAGQTLVFANGSIGNVDRVTDFISGTDKMDVTNANVAPTPLFGGNGTTALALNQVYVLYGAWAASTGTFTVAAGYLTGASQDALVYQGNSVQSANTHSGIVLLTGLGQALVAADFS